MTKQVDIFNSTVSGQTQAVELMEKLLAVADSKSVFSEPVESGEYKVITASEVSVGMGFGFGSGRTFGSVENSEESGQADNGYGGGGGGGGASTARPVAAIEIGPHGVRVEPIVDPTKIAVAFFTTLISIFTIVGWAKNAANK